MILLSLFLFYSSSASYIIWKPLIKYFQPHQLPPLLRSLDKPTAPPSSPSPLLPTSHLSFSSLGRPLWSTKSGMSKRSSKRVSFSPDVNEKPTMLLKQGGGCRVSGHRRRVAIIWSFRLPRSSSFFPVRFLRRLGDRVVRALRFMSRRRRSSRRVSSSSLTRSRSLVDPIDSHRAEAIEDCIEFLNSSACFQRSNSVSGSSC